MAHYSSGQYRFDERVEDDGRLVVHGFHPPDRPTLEYVWVIDPAMDHAVREIEQYSLAETGGRRRIWHGLNQYRLVQGKWWPHLVSIEAETGESKLILTCVRVEFDKPEHPQAFNGVDSLAPVGVEVRGAVDSRPGKQPLSFMRYIGGGKIVSEEEFNAQKDQYDLEPLRHWQSEIERNRRYLPGWATDATGRLGVQDVEWDPDLWLTYVRRWIIFHSNPRPSQAGKRTPSPSSRPAETRFDPLDGNQKDAAYGILADCKKRAEAVARIRKFRIDDLTKQLTQFDATAQKDPKQTERLKEQIESLRSERDPKVAAIFEELKTRLGLILQSTQAHRPPATSQPAP